MYLRGMILVFSGADVFQLFLGGGAAVAAIVLGLGLIVSGTRGFAVYGTYLVALALTLTNRLFANTGILSQIQSLYFVPLEYSFWFGPLLFLTTRSMVSSKRIADGGWPHLIVPLAQAAFYFTIGFRSDSVKSGIWQTIVEPWYQWVEQFGSLALFIGYAIASLAILRQATEGSEPRWLRELARSLRTLIIVTLTYAALETAYAIVDLITWEFLGINVYNIDWYSVPSNTLMSIATYASVFLGIFSLREGLIRSLRLREADTGELDEASQQVRARRLYLMPDLTAALAAESLGITRTNLSELLRQRGMSFVEWINQFRLEAFREAIREDLHRRITLLSIGLDCGFGSKATFNRVVKEMTGKTPSELAEELQSGVSSRGETDPRDSTDN